MVESQIEQYVLEKFEEEGYQDFFLLEVKHNPTNNKVVVYVDSDSAMTLERSAKLNRYLQNKIDEAGFLGEKYVLDVSSPGVDSPLKLLRQYKKNIGRTLEVTFQEGEKDKKQKGLLMEVDEKHILLQYDIKEKQGKKKITTTVEKEIPFDIIQKAIVKISFK